MDVTKRIFRMMQLAGVSSFLVACGGGENTGAAVFDNGDATPPTLSITTPTTSTHYLSNIERVSIAGIATDDIGVTEVKWRNDRGGEGSVIGTINWRYENLKLSKGENIITVSAKDSNNNVTESSITITYRASDINNLSLAETKANDSIAVSKHAVIKQPALSGLKNE